MKCQYKEYTVLNLIWWLCHLQIKDFIIISDNAYSRQQILDMVNMQHTFVIQPPVVLFGLTFAMLCIIQEKLMLNTLKFNMCIPTPYVFLVRLLKAAASDQQVCNAFS